MGRPLEVLPCEVRAAVPSVGGRTHQGGERTPEEVRTEEQEGAVALPVRPAAVPAAGPRTAGARAERGQAGGEGAGTTAPATPPAPALPPPGHHPDRRPLPPAAGR